MRQAFDIDAPRQPHPRVVIRPEPFGANAVSLRETRRLTFLKTAALTRVVRALDQQPTARVALTAAGVLSELRQSYRAALSALATSSMICRRPEKGESR